MVIRDSNLAIEDSVFSGLSFFGQGAIVLAHSNVTFLNATFTANNNSAGGKVPPLSALTPVPTSSKAAQTALKPSSSGGIVLMHPPQICQGCCDLRVCVMKQSVSAITAGAIYANDTSNITVLDSTFQGNGGGQGGAISLWNSSLLVNGTDFQGNIGQSAGAHQRREAFIQTLKPFLPVLGAQNESSVFLFCIFGSTT